MKHRFSSSLIRQGRHKFYTLSIPSDVLAKTTFVTSRNEDPKEGFQRTLDKKRAQEIADYVDSGLGTIPSSIILSAQPDANLKLIGGGKTLEFEAAEKAFLILDGQHRVYGFSLAKTSLRIPVVIYNNLTRVEETRLFIDINTKQKPVPNELLLDIKKLAEYETDDQRFKGDIFDLFSDQNDSALAGLMSPSTRARGKISRTTFYSALTNLTPLLSSNDPSEVYTIINQYLSAVTILFTKLKIEDHIVSPNLFKALMNLFPETARRVKNKYGKYSIDGFLEILTPMATRISVTKITKIQRGYQEIYQHLSQAFKNDFSL